MAVDDESWKKVAHAKQEERLRKIPDKWRLPSHTLPSSETFDVLSFPELSGFFSDAELAITKATASHIVQNVASKTWTAVQVTEAFCKRASVAQQLLNCLSEINFTNALQRATELDAYLAQTGKTVGPLHGLPISLKDQFQIAGLDTTMGYVSQAHQPAKEDSTVVAMLKNLGAVIYCKTNVPTTLMCGETINNIFGRTVNPANRQLTPGGSSGGETALVSFHGSPLGIGTDIGGSIRNPATFTGLWALRPSNGRVSYQRANNSFLGQETINSCAGPFTHSPHDINLFMSSLASQQPWLLDPVCLPIPWRQDVVDSVQGKKLCFAWACGDGIVRPHPPLRRAMDITKKKLEEAGHTIIEWIPKNLNVAGQLALKVWRSDGGADVRAQIDPSGEPWIPEVKELLQPVYDDATPKLTVFDLWQIQRARQLFATEWLENWNRTAEFTGTGRPIDGLIMPVLPFTAKPHGGRYPYAYGSLSPVLDLSTGVFPVTRVDQELDQAGVDYVPLSEVDEEVHKFYEGPEKWKNATVGLQLIGRRLEEEKVVGMLIEIEKALNA
ncbi:amidase [Stereum hirsutum FP-91666 SS1]|uniref:amidase n=1 Tax=Stereum hirsutum (strain FP-91666) TaxID=721885 RepID=UPI00044495AA|nr:amidase [Stereum hirsutum FP-91666 SS1]EIM86154.1 amidase [Stereum hirsutum FP-91666 SS1]